MSELSRICMQYEDDCRRIDALPEDAPGERAALKYVHLQYLVQAHFDSPAPTLGGRMLEGHILSQSQEVADAAARLGRSCAYRARIEELHQESVLPYLDSAKIVPLFRTQTA